MSLSRGRKKRKESGLRRIFERSVKELKTEAHTEEEEWPSLPPASQTSHPAADFLQQGSKTTDDMSKDRQWEEENSVPEMAKDTKVYGASEDEPQTEDSKKKSERNNELQQKDNVLTSRQKEHNTDFPAVEEKENTRDSQGRKTLSKFSDKWEREKPRGSRESRHTLKENTVRRIKEETKRSRSNELKNKRDTSSTSRASGSRGPVNRRRDSDGRGRRERERRKARERRLSRSSGRRKEAKVVRPETSRLSKTESEDDTRNRRDQQECGVVEDWMNDLLDVPYLDPTEIIIPTEKVLPDSRSYRKRFQNNRKKASNLTFHEKRDQLESIQVSGNSMDDRSNLDNCKEQISEMAVEISTTDNNGNQGSGLVLQFEEEWECQEIPSETIKMEEDKFLSTVNTDLELTESVIETIVEERVTLNKETNALEKSNPTCDLHKIETEDSDELLGNTKDQPEIRETDQTSEKNSQGQLSSHSESDDRLCAMVSKDTQGKENDFTKDGDCKNISKIDTTNNAGEISKEDQNKQCEEECNRESSESLSSSVSSKPVMSSVEDWSSEYLDSEEHSDTYHKIVQDKIVALKSRIPVKMSTSHRGQERDLGCRGRQRQRDGPFQSYLKTIHFEDGTNIDQSNNADNCAIIGAEFNKEYVQTTEEEKTIAPTGENFLANKMEEDHPSVCTKKNSGGESKWPSRPPGFIISLPSHSLDDIEQVKPSPATIFHKNIQNTVETLEKCKKLYGSISKEHKGESRVEVSSLSATFQGLDLDSTFEEKRVIKDFKNSDELISNGENWENSLYDVDTMDLHVSRKEMSDVAVVPDVNVGNLGKKSVVEHCVPEDQEALDSSVESCSFPHFSNRICDSQNTLNGIPTLSEYENSVKEEDLVSQYEDSLEDIGHQSPPQSEFIPNEESSSSCSKSSRQNYEHFQRAPARHEERRLENRKKALERRKDARYGLKCHCPADCVQFWVWRSCLCQDPYLYSIQSGTDGHPAKNVISYGPYEEERRPRSNSLSITPDESGKVLEEDIDSRQALQQKENAIRRRDLSSDSLFSPHSPRELGILRTVARSGREQDECSGLDQNNSSNGAEDESLELSDEDSSDRCSADSPTSEDADIPEYSAEREQENSVPYQYLASYPPVMNYMGYPPGYSFYPPYPAAYPGAQAALGRRYPGPYPEPYDPYPPAYLSGRYSRQQCVDGQLYPDHPGYLPAMFYPHFMMVDGWREASLHHGEPHLGFIPRYVYPSSHEGHESSTGRCRRESESHASSSREVGHGSIAEDAGHHHNIVDCHHNLKKKPKDTAGRGVSKVSSILTEELPSKNVYIPPHKRVPNVHGQYVARENRPTNNKDISPPSSHLYQNCKETPRTWREERSHLDGSLDIGSSEVSYWRTQQNRMLSCPTTLEHNSNAHNIKKSFASMHYELHQQQDGQGQHTLTELSQSGNASEDEPSGCDLFLASSSEDSTPTSRPYRFNDQKQTMDRYPDTGTLDWRSALLERCNVYGVGYIDSHCHIDFLFNRLDFKGRWSDFQVQNMKTFPSSYLGCVAVFCNPNSFKQEGLWRSLSKEENVWLTFGCHPKNARDFTKWNLEGLRKCLLNSRVVALGEIGLDYSGVFVETKELQKSVFKKQIRMALDMRKPLVIHCREAEEDCLDILKQMVPRLYKIHCHCFTGDFTSAKLWLDYFPNLYIGLTPLVTYRTAKGARDVAKFIPLKRLLLESDAPYFVPRTIPKESMNYSHPGLCVTVAEEVARLKNISVQEVLKACLENTRDMYKI